MDELGTESFKIVKELRINIEEIMMLMRNIQEKIDSNEEGLKKEDVEMLC